jgi:hypothetical protein
MSAITLFEKKHVRRAWCAAEERWYFAIADVTNNPSYATKYGDSITCKLPSGGTNRFVRLVLNPN